jgi:two-component system, chemotaxis family, response regulator PixG
MDIVNQKTIKFRELISELNNIKNNALSGNLIIYIPDFSNWMLCFLSGKLAEISGGIDAIERWRRCLLLASINMSSDLTNQSITNKETLLDFNKIAQEYAAEEVLFDIIQFSQINGDRLSCRFIPVDDKRNQIKSIVPLIEIESILRKTIQLWQEWKRDGLSNCPPSLFPVIKSSKRLEEDLDCGNHLKLLILSIDGSKSIRSLAIYHQQQPIHIAQALFSSIESGIITLSKVKQVTIDLPVASEIGCLNDSDRNIILSDRESTQKAPLIACIDDSLSVYKHLEKIITSHGYRSFGIQEPLKIITSLIKNKPDLIFLDLVMPMMNGYEVCEQIRKTPSLAMIPVIILTDNDGLIDRVRTKFVGANGFLSKPIEVRKVLESIDKHLYEKQSPNVFTPGNNPINAINNSRVLKLDVPIENAKQILIIDDDINIRNVVAMSLNKLKGWDVFTVPSAKEGLERISIKNPDAIVLDLMMPEMDGLAFLRQLRSNPITKMIPVILLTASRHPPRKDLLTELGVLESISKPFLPVDLVRKIDLALEIKNCQ